MKRMTREPIVQSWSNDRLARPNVKIPIEHYRERDNEGPWAPAWIVAFCLCFAFWSWIAVVVLRWLGR